MINEYSEMPEGRWSWCHEMDDILVLPLENKAVEFASLGDFRSLRIVERENREPLYSLSYDLDTSIHFEEGDRKYLDDEMVEIIRNAPGNGSKKRKLLYKVKNPALF